jgi:hypothetical protein
MKGRTCCRHLRHQPCWLHAHHFASRLRLGPFFARRIFRSRERMNAGAAQVSGYSRWAFSMLLAF